MRIAIDGAGRIVVPKAVRGRLGFFGPAELELLESEGQLVLRLPPSDVAIAEEGGPLIESRSAGASQPTSRLPVHVLRKVRAWCSQSPQRPLRTAR